jgi:hypothetical protein
LRLLFKLFILVPATQSIVERASTHSFRKPWRLFSPHACPEPACGEFVEPACGEPAEPVEGYSCGKNNATFDDFGYTKIPRRLRLPFFVVVFGVRSTFASTGASPVGG